MKCWLVLVAALIPATARAMVGDPFEESVFVADAGLSVLTGIDWAPDGSDRLFVIRKDGEVRVIKNGALLPAPFATFSTLYAGSECGLVGMAFDPGFADNHYVYFRVCVSNLEQQIIRYTDVGSLGTDKAVILDKLPNAGANHDGGAIGFGPDGDLYWAIGDLGGGVGVDDDLTSLASKVGRVRVRGVTSFPAPPPNDNPFFDGTGPNDDYIWARGFRNPFTMTVHPASGKLWLNVVGTFYEQIFVVGRGDHAGWNDRENDQAPPYLAPVIAYRTNSFDTPTLAGAVRANGVATFTTNGPHHTWRGNKIRITQVSDTSFNGFFYVASAPSANVVTIAQAGPDASSSGGSLFTTAFGGCVTGGAFYTGTQFPPEYRGNFFFGDYNAGTVQRVTFDGAEQVTSVDLFGTGITQAIDVATGPDGFLYYARHDGTIYRLRHKGTDQNLIVSAQDLRLVEGGQAVLMVRLNGAPAAPLAVTVARSSGDADLSVASGASLMFTDADWSVPQPVRIIAGHDADSTGDLATFEVAAAGLGSHPVRARSIDDDGPILLLSTTQLAFVEGGVGALTARLSELPSSDVTVTVSLAGDSDVSANSPSLVFTPQNWMTPQILSLAAADDADTTDDTATLTLMASGPFGARVVAVRVADDDDAAPTIISEPATRGVVGNPYRYPVKAMGRPAPSLELTSAPSGMTLADGLIEWTPASAGSFAVTVRASNGIAPDASQGWTITVAADEAPRCRFTKPGDGEVVAGREQEWFGDGFDDVRTVEMQFFVDDAPVYTDRAGDSHYHFGGGHNLWDTTALADGPHRLRGVVTDTAGQTASCEISIVVANASPPVTTPAPKPRCGCSSDGGVSAAPLVWLLALVVGLRRRGSRG